MSKYFIVNDIDRPYERLIAEMQDNGTLCYVHPEMRKYKEYKNMSADRATQLEDFGITAVETENEIFFVKTMNSLAKYSSGEPREWQGSENFSIKKGN